MDGQSQDPHLSRLQTLWSQVLEAHDEQADARQAAREALLRRYAGAVRRYLLTALRDPHAADDLAQEFALRFLRGDFRRADPERGRFRDYVKTAVLNLIADHHRRGRNRPGALPADDLGPADSEEPGDRGDSQFRASWRDELLDRAWEALAQLERETGRPLHTVLKFRATNPKLGSVEMAEQVGKQLGKPVTAAGVRQTLHRARERFADLLLAAVADSLEHPTADRLEEELGELGLLEYCRPALDRRRGESG